MSDIKKIKPGDVLYQVQRRRMGNTSLRTTDVFRCVVRDVVLDPYPRALISWNNNPAEWWGEKRVRPLRTKEPVTINSIHGQARLATRAEIKALKEAHLPTREQIAKATEETLWLAALQRGEDV